MAVVRSWCEANPSTSMAPASSGWVIGGRRFSLSGALAAEGGRGSEYVDKGMEHYERKYQETKLQYLSRQAARLGLQLVPHQGVATSVH